MEDFSYTGITGYLPTQGVYVITTEEKWPCKIGITFDLSERVKQMQTGNWVPLAAYRFWFPFADLVAGTSGFESNRINTARIASVKLERMIHAKLRELDAHLNGEWFDIGAEDAEAVVLKIADSGGFRMVTPDMVVNARLQGLSRPSDALAAAELLAVANSAIAAMLVGQRACA